MYGYGHSRNLGYRNTVALEAFGEERLSGLSKTPDDDRARKLPSSVVERVLAGLRGDYKAVARAEQEMVSPAAGARPAACFTIIQVFGFTDENST